MTINTISNGEAGSSVRAKLNAGITQLNGLSLAAITNVAQSWTAQQTFCELKETVYTLTGTAVDPANGTIQKKTLSSSYTPTFNLEAGQSVLLTIVNANTNTVTWTNIGKWYGDAPIDFETDLKGDDTFIIWHDGTTVCALYAGGAS